MPLTEHIQLRLATLRDALTEAQARPRPVPVVAPAPELSADVMKQLTTQRPDLAKLITERAAALKQRAQEEAKAQEGLKQIYADALSRVTDLLKAMGSGGG